MEGNGTLTHIYSIAPSPGAAAPLQLENGQCRLDSTNQGVTLLRVIYSIKGNKMEETFEKESPPVEVKAPDDDTGGIGRRPAGPRPTEKEEGPRQRRRQTNQWVYGAQSRKRVRKEPSSTPGKKGRPEEKCHCYRTSTRPD
ncbi:hypothetical protein MHYP_G00034480 [Metynnis hypsauchen]